MHFSSPIERFEAPGGMAMHYAVVPDDLVQQLKEKTPARLVITLNDSVTWHGALMPLGKGRYYITVKGTYLKKLKLRIGDVAHFSVEKDTSAYGMPMPEELSEVLKQDPEWDRRFHALSAGKQRYIIYFVARFKSSQLRIDHSLRLIQNMVRMPEGKETPSGIFRGTK